MLITKDMYILKKRHQIHIRIELLYNRASAKQK
jgi:hypothetical protein